MFSFILIIVCFIAIHGRVVVDKKTACYVINGRPICKQERVYDAVVGDPIPCDGQPTNYTRYRYLAFASGSCTGECYANSTTILGRCYTSILGHDSFDCYDPKFNLLKFYDYTSSDASCQGNNGYYAQKDNGYCYPDWLQLNSLMWVAEWLWQSEPSFKGTGDIDFWVNRQTLRKNRWFLLSAFYSSL